MYAGYQFREGIEKVVMKKNLLCLTSDEIRMNNVKKPWPPTPHNILNNTSIKNTSL